MWWGDTVAMGCRFAERFDAVFLSLRQMRSCVFAKQKMAEK
jgi:hypothetical protein